jgi:WD40 repeat protein
VSHDDDECNNTNADAKSQWRLFATITGHARSIRDVKFAPISTSLVLATASFDGMVMIWECTLNDIYDSTIQENDRFEAIAQLEGHENEVKHVAWNQTGSLLASCGRDKTVWIWECFLPGTVGGMDAGGNVPGGEEGDFECLAVLQGHDGEFSVDVFCSVFLEHTNLQCFKRINGSCSCCLVLSCC